MGIEAFGLRPRPITCTMLCYAILSCSRRRRRRGVATGEGVSPPHCTVFDRHRRWACSFKRLVNEKKVASPTARKRMTHVSNDKVPFKRRLNDVIPTRDGRGCCSGRLRGLSILCGFKCYFHIDADGIERSSDAIWIVLDEYYWFMVVWTWSKLL